ncbi:MAG: hypothetical protein GTO40_11535 [Deltaproteobacteria bacterium]|nr:hypothetical protein [Deltaproteobacteria bacterium]
MEREKVKAAEPVSREQELSYEILLRESAQERERAKNGKLVIRYKDIPWRQNRQALIKGFLSSRVVRDTAASDWTCFIQDIKVHSGRHRHQGGIQLFVLEGEGTTVVDNENLNWEKWDLIILPVKPRGCEHQHFNKTPGKTAKWMAFQYHPFTKPLGSLLEQVEDSPDWKGDKTNASR